MPASDTTPILHHYDFSPFAEKIRLAFGLKGLAWHSVDAPSVMPKPDLVALTGGYRHIPVMQIGADVYCDTRCIARELDARWPSPPLLPATCAGVATAIEAWAERDLFWPVARFVSGVNADRVDPQLHVDRAAMRGKRPPSHERLRAVARRELGALRPQLRVVESMLADGRAFLIDDRPTQADLAVHHGLWFLSAMPIDCAGELDGCPATRAWMARVQAIGHGRPAPMSAAEALELAAAATPAPLPESIDDDTLPPPGTPVAVSPDGYETQPVVGTLAWIGPLDVAVRRRDARLGETTVHLPRVGYTVAARS
jgi:glutathione S-transferase